MLCRRVLGLTYRKSVLAQPKILYILQEETLSMQGGNERGTILKSVYHQNYF